MDDDEDIRFVVKLLLEQEGYDVELKGNENDLLCRFESIPMPDLVLLDKDINGVNGLDICKKLKNDPATKHIPIIMLSADPLIKNLYKNAGADEYLEKPFERASLINKIAAQFL